jgi:hypothetical protein
MMDSAKKTDRQTDLQDIENIFETSMVDYFDDSIRNFLKSVIEDIYYSHKALSFKLRLNHIDRAIFKFNQAKSKKYIYNTKRYFASCLISAIYETDFEELESID